MARSFLAISLFASLTFPTIVHAHTPVFFDDFSNHATSPSGATIGVADSGPPHGKRLFIDGAGYANPGFFPFVDLYTGLPPIPPSARRLLISGRVALEGPISPSEAAANLISANLVVLKGTNESLAEVQVSANSRAYGSTSAAGFQYGNPVGLLPNQTHLLEMDLNFDSLVASLSVNGTDLGLYPLEAGLDPTTLHVGVALPGAPEDPESQKYKGYFDDVSMTAYTADVDTNVTTPEPATLGMAAMGGLTLAGLRRIRRRN